MFAPGKKLFSLNRFSPLEWTEQKNPEAYTKKVYKNSFPQNPLGNANRVLNIFLAVSASFLLSFTFFC